jgi:hypothetical protein
MTKISSYSGLPRTTVDAIVRRLVSQGLLTEVRVGKRREYAVSHEDVAQNLLRLHEKLSPKQGPPVEQGGDMVLARERLHVLLLEYFYHYAGERVRVLVSQSREEVGVVHNLEHYVLQAADYSLQAEFLLSRRVATQARGSSTLNTVEAPGTYLNLVPDSFCTHYSDLLLFRDRALLINLLSGEVSQVSEEQTVATLRHLFSVASEVGWSVDLQSWMSGA